MNKQPISEKLIANHEWHVLFYGAGCPMPTFISRRIHSLSKAGVYCQVLLDYACSKKEIQELYYVNEFKIKNPIQLIRIIKYFLLHPRTTIGFYRNFIGLTGEKIKIRVLKAIRYALVIPKDIHLIHVLWLTHILDLEWIKKKYGIKLMASVRGSMVTIYPFKYPGYEQQLLRSFDLADSLHFVSKDLMEYCIDRWKINRDKCFVNYNGINLEKFKPYIFEGIKNEKIILIGVGALIWRKNFQSMLTIISQIDCLDKVELRIIGEGEERFILEYLIEKLNLNEQVKLLGALHSEQVLAELQGADIFLSTSYAEGLSNAVMEAAACGLPVVAFNCEGMSELILDGVNGYIVPQGNECAFIDKLNELLVLPARRKAMGEAARLYMEQNFDESIHIKAMIHRYKFLAISR